MQKNKASLLAGLLLSTAAPAVLADEAPGIHADFETSLGSFTCVLYYEDSPRAVANFIGLAEGSRPWIDPATGAIRREPFYDGLTFHRVIEGFMNQSGSRNAQGNDGPGYSFRDELDNGLLHDAPGILSMANSGPHTNGSQFFVTVEPTPWLDGGHTVFGSVVEGIEVVEAINEVPTDANDRPIDPVIIHSITIRRTGPDAEAFDIHAQGLPICRPVPGKLSATAMGQPIEYQMNAPQPPGSEFIVFESDDLASWARLGTLWQQDNGAGFEDIGLGNMSEIRKFYHFNLVEYSDSMGFSTTANLTIDISWQDAQEVLNEVTFQLDASGEAGSAEWRHEETEATTIIEAWVDSASAYQTTWIIRTEDHGYWGIEANFDSRSPNEVEGTAGVFRFAGGWQPQGSGPITVAFP